MNRYGLVYTWHLQHLKNKNHHPFKASRDDDNLPLRSRNQSKLRSQTPVSGTCHDTSSNASQDSRSSIADVDCPLQTEIIRARREMQAAKRRMEKTQVDLEEAEIRMQEMDLNLLRSAQSEAQTLEEYQLEIQQLSFDITQLRRELDSVCRLVSQKESILTCAQQRKASL